MRIVRTLLAAAFATTFLGCPTVTTAPGGYPARIEGIGDSPNYPLRAAGFERAEIIAYAPGMRHLSTAYNLLTPETQIAATIYLVPHDSTTPVIAERYRAEKAAIEAYHPGAKLLEEKEVALEKNGVQYKALKAAYELEGIFMHQRQQLYSEVLLWSHKDRYVKLRATAPAAQRATAAAKNLELLGAVNWAF